MGIVSSKCYYCGEPVQVDIQKDAWICPGCGEPFIVEKSIRLARKNKVNHKRVVVSPVRTGKSKTVVNTEVDDETAKEALLEEIVEESVNAEISTEDKNENPETAAEQEIPETEEKESAVSELGGEQEVSEKEEKKAEVPVPRQSQK